MGRKQGSRKGSMQFWPRKRALKALPRVNWPALYGKKNKPGLLGFIAYKVGMSSCYVKDLTPHSMTKNKKIIIPITILECPTIKILSIRFYKKNILVSEVLNNNLDKELKRKIKLPKEYKTKEQLEKAEKDYDDIRVIVYSQVKKTNVKKTPDISELGIEGKKEDKLSWAKENMSKEISISEVFKEGVLDTRGLTKGKGFQGPVKRFGIRLRVHKAEKGQRRVGSIGPWHPARISFRVPMAGQMGNASRVIYNNNIVEVENIAKKDINPGQGFMNYGKIKTDYILLRGSVPGPNKKQILLTQALRSTKKQIKKQYEMIELR